MQLDYSKKIKWQKIDSKEKEKCYKIIVKIYPMYQ